MSVHHGFYLARSVGPMAVELVDGVHGDPAGVATAARLHAKIFNDAGPWIMVDVRDVPDVDVSINEEAAATCARLVEGREP